MRRTRPDKERSRRAAPRRGLRAAGCRLQQRAGRLASPRTRRSRRRRREIRAQQADSEAMRRLQQRRGIDQGSTVQHRPEARMRGPAWTDDVRAGSELRNLGWTQLVQPQFRERRQPQRHADRKRSGIRKAQRQEQRELRELAAHGLPRLVSGSGDRTLLDPKRYRWRHRARFRRKLDLEQRERTRGHARSSCGIGPGQPGPDRVAPCEARIHGQLRGHCQLEVLPVQVHEVAADARCQDSAMSRPFPTHVDEVST